MSGNYFSWDDEGTGSGLPAWDDPNSTLTSPVRGVSSTQGDRGSNGPTGLSRLAELRANFESAVTARQHWDAAAEEDYGFYWGDQWPQSARTWLNDGGRPSLTLNKIKPIINTVCGYQTQNRYEPDFLPRTADDLQLAEVRRAVTKYVLDKSAYPTIESRVFRDALLGGVGYAYVGYEYTDAYPDGHIVIKRLSPFDVYVDPESKELDFGDAEYYFIASWQSKGRVANAFPEWKDNIFSINEDEDYQENPRNNNGGLNHKPGTLWLSTDRRKVRVVTAWYRTYRVVNYVRDPEQPGNPDALIAIAEGVSVPPEMIERTAGLSEIRCATFVQNTLLEDVPSPYSHNRFPIVPLIAYYTGEGDTPHGMVRDLKDPQLELNKRRSQILHIINTTAFNGVMAEEGAFTARQKELYTKFGSKPGQIVEVTPGALTSGRIHEIVPKPLPEALARLESAFADDLKAISGINEEMMGTEVPANASGRAIELRQKSSVTQIALLFDNLRDFKRQLMLNLWGEGSHKGLIQQYMTMPMIIRVSENTEQPDFMPVNTPTAETDEAGNVFMRTLNDLTVGDFDIIITDSPSSPSKRYSDFLALMEMMKTPLGGVLANVIPDIFLELSDLPNKTKISARIQAAMQQQQQQQAMMMQQGNASPLGSMPGVNQTRQPRSPQGSQSNPMSPVNRRMVQSQLSAQ